MTNLRAMQAKEEIPQKNYCKNFKEVTVEKIKAFVGLHLLMENTVVKPQYCEYWQSEGKNFFLHRNFEIGGTEENNREASDDPSVRPQNV
ncbi:hypothetical protein PoB_001494200 [Plakobranchus ocellatus]|uniref:PiggyBac transposable element-derived protein domain-containing protein n=1 Tax=Plakobranchus ocellatus TaxID=259542 RepID=A0AAV3Z1N3_9GAST|nr:hypothetical protein PoB_001494200 [Plakobranchus ocellatus]